MKSFYTDHYFQIGSVHYSSGKPCQDYAISGVGERAACAIVSDGCSTGRHTDFGSRIQAMSLLGAMKRIPKISGRETHELVKAIQGEKRRQVREAKIAFGLSNSDMLATLVYAYLSQSGGLVQIEGDGVVVKGYRDGTLVMGQYEWQDNMPFYPSYRDANLESFVERHGDDLDALRLLCTTVELGPESYSTQVKELTLMEGISGVTEVISEKEMELLSFVAVFTDGVSQIEGVEWSEAVKDLVSFKSLTGEFAKRRMIRGLKNYAASGRKAFDDISVAVIRIEDKTEEGEDHDNGNIEGEH